MELLTMIALEIFGIVIVSIPSLAVIEFIDRVKL